MLSAVQVKDGLRNGEMTYLTAPTKTKPNQKLEVPELIVDVLEEFTDVMPLELPKNLPAMQAIHQNIELEMGTKPPTKARYRMALVELLESSKMGVCST